MIIVVIFFSMVSGFVGGIFADTILKPAFSKTPNIIDADMVKSHSIDIIDSQGNTIMHLGKDLNDTVGIELYDKNFNLRSGLFLSREGFPMLALYGSHGKTGASLGVTDDVPSLGLYDSHGKYRAIFNLVNDAPSLDLYDSHEKIRASIGDTTLETFKTGATTETGESSIVLFDRKGKVMWKVP